MNSSNSDSTTTTTSSSSSGGAALNELKGGQNHTTFSTQPQQHHHPPFHHHQQRNNYAPTPPSDLLYHHAGSGSSSSSISATGIATTTTNAANIIGSSGNNTFGSINKMTATVDGGGGGGNGAGSVNNTTIIPSANNTNVMSPTTNNTSSTTTNSGGNIPDYDNRQSINNGGGVGGGISMGGNGGGGSVIAVAGNPTVGGGSGVFSKPQERYVWEMRARSPNVTPASTVLNSPDLNTDMQYSIHPHQRQLQQIRVGRSPGSQFEQHNILPQGLASPGSPTDVGKADGHCLRDGEIVVFDDIDTNWMNKSNNSYSSNHSTSQHHRADSFHGNEDILKVTKMIGQLPIAEYEGSPRRFGNQQQATQKSTSGAASTGTTGILPKRPPGFPQRVSPMAVLTPQQQQQQHQEAAHARHQQMQQQHQFYAQATSSGSCSSASFFNNNDSANNKSPTGNLIDIDADDELLNSTNTNQSHSSSHDSTKSKVKTPTFDYLYEFSETRKVLEDFFKGNNDDEKRFTDFTESGDDMGSCDTHHEYQSSQFGHTMDEDLHIEQSYIGQRLARIPKEELYLVHRSPKKQKQMATTQQQQEPQPQHPQHHQQQEHSSSSQQQHNQHHQSPCDNILYNDNNDIELYIDSNSRSSGDLADTELEANLRHHSRNFTLSPETTDYDSNCGDLDSLSNDINCSTDYGKLYTSMPVLEDGLSSGHASDTENNCQKYDSNGGSGSSGGEGGGSISNNGSGSHNGDSLEINEKLQQQQQQQEMLEQNKYNNSLKQECMDNNCSANNLITNLVDLDDEGLLMSGRLSGSGGGVGGDVVSGMRGLCLSGGDGDYKLQQQQPHCLDLINTSDNNCCNNDRSAYEPIYATVNKQQQQQHQQSPPPPPAPQPHRPQLQQQLQSTQQSAMRHLKHPGRAESVEIQEAMKEIRSALQRAKTQPEKLKFCDEVLPPDPESPIWVPRKGNEEGGNAAAGILVDGGVGCGGDIIGGTIMDSNKLQCDEEEPDTDLETDRLLGQQRNDEQDFFDDKTIWPKTSRIGSAINSSGDHSPTTSDIAKTLHVKPQFSSATIRQGIGTSLTPNSPEHCQMVGGNEIPMTTPEKITYTKSPTGSIKSLKDSANSDKKAKSRNKEGCFLDPAVLIEGVLFRARYLGSTQLVCEGQPTKSTRMMQAEEAVSRIKAPEGENQPSTEVDLFISTEKIMVLNTDLKEIMMDHALRTISYIADIGDLVVLMARRRFVHSDPCNSTGGSGGGGNTDSADNSAAANGGGGNTTTNGKDKESKDTTTSATSTAASSNNKHNRTPKMICHVFESDEAQFIAQSIGQAFQVAYMEFLKANGIENENLAKEMDYQEVLNSQEIFGDELEIFAKKELQKEVVVPKAKGEILGVVIVESGWGSMLPTVVIANLMSGGAAARCGQLNIGDQLIAINGLSLVGLPLSTCQNYIRNAKNQTAVKFTVVPCPPVVEVKILRPKALFQLGFSVQNGVICSLLRGGIAERGGVRVGHRIIEINNQSVVAVPHDTIVKLLSSSVGEILMKTMPTSMFRLLTGQETPIYI
ncbi:uncharacterized protein LOC133322993 [Musca vetustissima]|uniref:uncharacterized protein LOC133322993 n=1 Tax=Musca vetustissima TaxID=27455 RepID=UPI002AB6DEF2|nr:uncharacterized protein LOC133322993 [Musca vetustissima]